MADRFTRVKSSANPSDSAGVEQGKKPTPGKRPAQISPGKRASKNDRALHVEGMVPEQFGAMTHGFFSRWWDAMCCVAGLVGMVIKGLLFR